MSEVIVLDGVSHGDGWYPIRHMISLFSDIFDCEVHEVVNRENILTSIFAALLPKRKPNTSKKHLLIIVANVSQMDSLFYEKDWRNNFNMVSIWIIDSFWTEWMTRLPIQKHFDHLFIGYCNDFSFYEGKFGSGKVTVLPWASDVLGLGSNQSDGRNIDVLRIGRQPTEWDSDVQLKKDFADLGLRYEGRPQINESSEHLNYVVLMRNYYSKSKVVLAQSNLVDSSFYTHPEKEYITARWTDALACGCTVAGKQPVKDESFDKLLWDKATVDFTTKDKFENMLLIKTFLDGWLAENAKSNHLNALKNLDWRWRFEKVANVLGLADDKLQLDLAKIRNIISSS